MTFGSEKGNVIAHGECPRCQAPCVVRAFQKENTHMIVCHITCEKCHLIRFNGFTSVEALAAYEVMERLENARSKAKRTIDKRRIDRKINELNERIKLYELGL